MKLVASAVALLVLSVAAPVSAQEQLTVGLGGVDVFDDNNAVLGNIEYRGDYIWRGLRPQVGAWMDTDTGRYGYAGFIYDFRLNDSGSLFLSPSTAVGLYGEGDSNDLGGAVEFRSGVELGYQLESGSRLGVALHHLSNASIYDKNPGTETVTFTVSTPLNIFSGK